MLHTAQDCQRGSKKRGRPALKGEMKKEDRKNAVTLITLRLPTEMRLCQLTIISYTRWPFLFLNRGSTTVQSTKIANGLIVFQGVLCAITEDESGNVLLGVWGGAKRRPRCIRI